MFRFYDISENGLFWTTVEDEGRTEFKTFWFLGIKICTFQTYIR